ncbi:MAG: putative lipid II flippase FtsW [Acidimicrobiales bacterium]
MASTATKGSARRAAPTVPVTRLDRFRSSGESLRHVLMVACLVLSVLGLTMVLSASSDAGGGSPWAVFARQALSVILGLMVLVAVSNVDYRCWRRLARPAVIVSVVLLVLVLVPGVGVYVDGSRRWLGSAQIRFQPSEVAKLATLLFMADLLARRSRSALWDWRRTLRPVLLMTALVAGLILAEPDMGTAVILVVMVAAMIFAGGLPLRQLAPLALAGVVLVGLASSYPSYRRARVDAFFQSIRDPASGGYQSYQSRVALGEGGVTGLGLGGGRAKLGFLPNAHTDFILAIVGEETGLVGTLLVVAAFGAIAFVGIRVALKASDRFGALLAVGATAWIISQALANVAVVTGLVPVTGIPLPFLSVGGSSLVMVMMAVGLVRSVARYGPAPRERTARNRGGGPEPVGSRRRGSGPTLAVADHRR